MIVLFEAGIPVVHLTNIVEVHLFFGDQLKHIFLVTNENCIDIAAIVKFAFVPVLFEFWFVHIFIVVNLLEADYIRLAVPILEYFLHNSLRPRLEVLNHTRIVQFI